MKKVIHLLGGLNSMIHLGEKIACTLQYQCVDVDHLLYKDKGLPFGIMTPVEQKLKYIQEKINEKKGIILIGSFMGWGDSLISYLDGVIFVTRDDEDTQCHFSHEDLHTKTRLLHKEWVDQMECDTLYVDNRLTIEEQVKSSVLFIEKE